MKRFISLFLILVFTLMAVSCSGGDTHEEITVGLLGESGEALYRIVRPDDATTGEIKIANNLKKKLKELTGADFVQT